MRTFDRGWCIAQVRTATGLVTVVGALIGVKLGDSVLVRGTWTEHPKFGRQLKATDCTADQPADVSGVVSWMTSRLPEIGMRRARELVELFGVPGIWEIIEREPSRLSEVKGITPARVEQICAAYHAHVAERDRMVRLKTWGLTDNQIGRVISQWGTDHVEAKLRENPYRLAEEVDGFGFLRADEVALRMGVARTSAFRIRAGVAHMLAEAAQRGHVYVPSGAVVKMTGELLGIDPGLVAAELAPCVGEGKAHIDGDRVYQPRLHAAELGVAQQLAQICRRAA